MDHHDVLFLASLGVGKSVGVNGAGNVVVVGKFPVLTHLLVSTSIKEICHHLILAVGFSRWATIVSGSILQLLSCLLVGDKAAGDISHGKKLDGVLGLFGAWVNTLVARFLALWALGRVVS